MSDKSSEQKASAANQRFVEADEDTVVDLKKRLVWLKKDSWQLAGKWMSWTQARDYGVELNKSRMAGFNDWRMPTSDEIKSLFDKSQDNKDHMGQKAFLVSVFPSGFGFLCWTSDVRNKIQAVRFGFRKGVIMYDDIYRVSRGSTRFVRDMEKVKPVGRI